MADSSTFSGNVVYLDGTPAPGATIRVTDLDLGSPNDVSAPRTTDQDGHYAGLTIAWNEGFGDIGMFTFRVVDAVGRTHTGPLLTAGGQAAPVVLPGLPPKPVPKSARELVQIILLSAEYEGDERRLYEFIELSTETLTRSVLGGHYRRLTFVTGADATLAGLVAALDAAAARSATRAVDLIFSTHGSTNGMTFADGKRKTKAVRAAFADVPADRRAKFRAVFSTACIGHTHTDDWRAVGFTEASGSKGIYADSAVSYAPFLTAWAAERTFAEAVEVANSADALDIVDEVAREYYRSSDDPERRKKAAQVDSTRVRRGPGRSRIYSTP